MAKILMTLEVELSDLNLDVEQVLADYRQNIESAIELGLLDAHGNPEVLDYKVSVEALPQVVLVSHWEHHDARHGVREGQPAKDFVLDITDQRATNGQLYVDLYPHTNGENEEEALDTLSAIVEVATPPASVTTDAEVPVIRVGNGDENMISVWKTENGLAVVNEYTNEVMRVE